MSDLLALDVAILPPAHVRDRAIELSAALPAKDFEGLRLDEAHLPHVTLTQQFVRAADLERIFDRLDVVLPQQPPLTLEATGGGKTLASTVWMAIARSDALTGLHERLMDALREFEHAFGGASAFAEGDARAADIAWVSGYRLKSSFLSFAPHITLGHANEPPRIEPFTFVATDVAACHLGRFCTCRRVLRKWTLAPRP
ncbi:MAG: 2'-5' RNA ligase family protein [Acidobacteria bacterium]|nr:2'-5' RNA ligase family protein [Acidobacteriota bacterium]